MKDPGGTLPCFTTGVEDVTIVFSHIGDCVELAEWFLQRFQQTLGRHRLRLSDEAIDAIRDHEWPGNVAELSNAVKQAVITAEGPSVRASDLGLASSSTAYLFGEGPLGQYSKMFCSFTRDESSPLTFSMTKIAG